MKTPHLDALAANGVRFENFYTASPVCMPNRASFMTSRYPRVHGLRHNGCVLPASANTFVDVLAADGYKTAAIGKSHLRALLRQPAGLGRCRRKPVPEEVCSTTDLPATTRSHIKSSRRGTGPMHILPFLFSPGYASATALAYLEPPGSRSSFSSLSRIMAGQVLGYVQAGGFRAGTAI